MRIIRRRSPAPRLSVRHGWLDFGTPASPPHLPFMHPLNASWYTSATYELLTANFVHVRVREWTDRVHTDNEHQLAVKVKQRNVVELSSGDVPALAKVLAQSTRGLRPAYVMSQLATGGKLLDVTIPGDGTVQFRLVPEDVFLQRSFKPSTRPGNDSLLSCPKVAVHKSINPEEALRSPYSERALRYLWAFGTSPVLLAATRTSLSIRVKRDEETHRLVREALLALTGHEHVSVNGNTRYGTAELHIAGLREDRDLHNCRYINPLVTRLSVSAR